MATIQTLIAQYADKHAASPSEEYESVLSLLARAAALSEQAQREFVKAFDFEFACDQQVYVGSARQAAALYPALSAEAAAAGLEIVCR